MLASGTTCTFIQNFDEFVCSVVDVSPREILFTRVEKVIYERDIIARLGLDHISPSTWYALGICAGGGSNWHAHEEVVKSMLRMCARELWRKYRANLTYRGNGEWVMNGEEHNMGLPVEVWRLIAQKLIENGHMSSAMRMRGVCRILALAVSEVPAVLFNKSPVSADGVCAVLMRRFNISTLGEVTISNSGLTDSGAEMLRGLTQLNRLNLSGNRNLSDSGIAHLGGLTGLTHLNISQTAVSGTGLVALVGMGQLRVLKMAQCKKVDDEGVLHISGLSRVTTLDLSYTSVCSPGVSRICDGLKNIESLSLNGCGEQIGDDGVGALCGLPRLRELNLFKCSVGGGGIEALATLEDLEILNLGWNPNFDYSSMHYISDHIGLRELDLSKTACLEDKAMEHLVRLKNLVRLNLAGTRSKSHITDVGMQYLQGLVNLTEINLEHAKVTDEGLAYLRGLLNLKVLNLGYCEHLSDECLDNFLMMKCLTTLSTWGSPVSNTALNRFWVRMRPR